jgi:integrase
MEQVQHPGLAAGWVFPSRKGGLYRCYPMNKVLAQSIRAAGIKKHLSQHGLRRTFNDLLTRVVSGRVARGILGHSTVQMTDHYSFVDRSEKRAAQAAVLQLVHAESKAGKQGEECGEALPQGQAA